MALEVSGHKYLLDFLVPSWNYFICYLLRQLLELKNSFI